MLLQFDDPSGFLALGEDVRIFIPSRGVMARPAAKPAAITRTVRDFQTAEKLPVGYAHVLMSGSHEPAAVLLRLKEAMIFTDQPFQRLQLWEQFVRLKGDQRDAWFAKVLTTTPDPILLPGAEPVAERL